MSQAFYSIVKLSPCEDSKFCWIKIVELFDTKKDAEFVLKALEEVNINFNVYKVIQISEWWDGWKQVEDTFGVVE